MQTLDEMFPRAYHAYHVRCDFCMYHPDRHPTLFRYNQAARIMRREMLALYRSGALGGTQFIALCTTCMFYLTHPYLAYNVGDPLELQSARQLHESARFGRPPG